MDGFACACVCLPESSDECAVTRFGATGEMGESEQTHRHKGFCGQKKVWLGSVLD